MTIVVVPPLVAGRGVAPVRVAVDVTVVSRVTGG